MSHEAKIRAATAAATAGKNNNDDDGIDRGEDSHREEISPVDYRLIGLSPQYWSYTPLLIGDLTGMPLINGVDCFVKKCRDVSRVSGDADSDAKRVDADRDCIRGSDAETWRILPLSRVLLRGTATAIDRRPNGCTLIVLDDGTGSVDCRYWDNSHGGSSAFNLPSLLPEHDGGMDKRRGFRFAVGDSLEILGKMKTLTAGNTSDACNLSDISAMPLEVRFGCVREVHATSVCVISEGQTRMANQWNGEIVHWLKCMDFSRAVGSNVSGEKKSCTIRNGKDVIPLLGSRIASSVLGGDNSDISNFESNSDNSSILTRKCCQTSQRFRNALFYCHCESTLEALDPNFTFRDALLNRLLDMEARLQHPSDSLHPSAAEDCMDLCGLSDPAPPPLLFTFESIYKDDELATLAGEVVASTTSPKANAQRLVRKTFSAMTNDGILSLFGEEDDVYLLVSRSRVIEPFLRMAKVEGGGSSIPPPFFIRSVPRKRIAGITNWIEETV